MTGKESAVWMCVIRVLFGCCLPMMKYRLLLCSDCVTSAVESVAGFSPSLPQ